MSGNMEWDSYYRDRYEVIGNRPINWEISADHLLLACKVIDRNWKEAREEIQEALRQGDVDDLEHREEINLGFASLLLKGYAVECLMKAIGLLRGEQLVRNGKYRGPKHHNLYELARYFKLIDTQDPLFDKEQKDVLKRLSQYTTSLGRYPIPKNEDEYAKQQTGVWVGICDMTKLQIKLSKLFKVKLIK